MDLSVSILKWSGLICTLILLDQGSYGISPSSWGQGIRGRDIALGGLWFSPPPPLNIVRLLPLLCPVIMWGDMRGGGVPIGWRLRGEGRLVLC